MTDNDPPIIGRAYIDITPHIPDEFHKATMRPKGLRMQRNIHKYVVAKLPSGRWGVWQPGFVQPTHSMPSFWDALVILRALIQSQRA